MENLTLLRFDDHAPPAERTTPHPIEQAIGQSRRAGLHVGRRVRIGHVQGEIVGYNIARSGNYYGARFPLLVSTEYGVIKCAPNELVAA